MSWDIFVQDIPVEARTLAEIPDDFSPQPIGAPSHILDAIRAAAPFADLSDPTWVRIDAPGISMEVGVRAEDPLYSFAFHIRGGDCSAGVVADILQRLQLRAIDPASDSGIFDSSKAAESLQRWQQYRDRVLESREV
ncbi:MAG TPA: hypothetical protein VGM54_06630 [Chthoniobacter sp.]|jgi:hypothetical protein